MRKTLRKHSQSVVVVLLFIFTAAFAASGAAQTDSNITTQGVTAINDHGAKVVFDENNQVYWLADANFAASEGGQQIQAQMGVAGIAPNGMMDYPTAQAWVAALNGYNNGQGYLGHTNWQLPASPMLDSTCGSLGPQGASFGGLCQGSTLGNLYYVGLQQVFPADVARTFATGVGPMYNLQLAYYWTQAPGGIGGIKVFSFASGQADSTTTRDSFYYVLPMIPSQFGPIVGADGTAPTCDGGSNVVLYTSGPAAYNAIYDCVTGNTWLANANLAATSSLGIVGTDQILEPRPFPSPNPITLTPALIQGGAMLYTTATQWITALNAIDNGPGNSPGYLGSNHWQLPDVTAAGNDLVHLYNDLNLSAMDVARFQVRGKVGPFFNLQPFFYWEQCVPQPIDFQYPQFAQGAADCVTGNAPAGLLGNQLNYDFTFGYGLQGTDAYFLRYFVIVNYPAGSSN